MNPETSWLEISEMAVRWLNDRHGSGSPSYERVSNLIEGLHSLEPLLREHPVASSNSDGTTHYGSTSPAALLRDAINSRFAEYRFVPALIATDANKMAVKWFSAEMAIETGIIEIVCDLFNAERLPDISRCEVCKRWFVKTKSDHRFCSPNCNSTFHAQTEKGRQYHQDKAKEQYERERKPKLDKVRKVLKEWERKPLRAGVDWKERMVRRVPEVSKAFLTRAVKAEEILPPI